MKNSLIRYPKSKRCFPWLVRVRMNGKKMVVMLFKVIMEDSDNSFGSGFKGQVFYLVFYIWGKTLYHISYGIWMWGWDGFVIGYTHKGEEMTVVLIVRDFVERYLVIKLSFPLMCLIWKDYCENQFDHLSNWGWGSIFLLNWRIFGKDDMSISTGKLCPRRWNWNFSIPCFTASISLNVEW